MERGVGPCPHMIWIESQKMHVPCGVCMYCRIQRSREWAVRLMHESQYHDSCVFLTCTYDNDHLPEHSSLRKRDYVLFMKRLRKQLDRKIKYFSCGEYGGQFGRPHYHAIVFGMSADDFDYFDTYVRDGTRYYLYRHSSWPYGLINVEQVTYQSCRYVAGYIQKTVIGDAAKAHYGVREHPFSLMSKGLGRQHALDNAARYRKRPMCTMFGAEVGFPRYYAKVLDINMADHMDLDFKDNRYDDLMMHSRDDDGNFDFELYDEHLAKYHAQRERTINKLVEIKHSKHSN